MDETMSERSLSEKKLREDEEEDEFEYEIKGLRDEIKSTRHDRYLARLSSELHSSSTINRRRSNSNDGFFARLFDFSQDFCFHPNNKWYRVWEKFIVLYAIYSSFFTPFEFGFFRGLPKNLFLLDIVGQATFVCDMVLQFFVAYRDNVTYKMIYNRSAIALRYLKSYFFLDLLGCLPWDILYKASGNSEEVRFLLWIRLSRTRKVIAFLHKLEKDIRINYLFCRILKLLVVEIYCTHTAACIFYYLATSLSVNQEGYTWIGSLKLGDYSYSHFREIDIWRRYVTSLYFAIVTMSTVGYGDIHAVNPREMIFVMIYVSFDMVLGAYLVGNITALIVKGSKTERYRDKMSDIFKYLSRNKLGKDIRTLIKDHLRLQYECSYTDAAVLQDLPISIRAKISQNLYKPYIENVSLFKECSAEFINQIVTRVCEEFFFPGELIMEQGDAVDQIYIVCHGVLEEVSICDNGAEETVSLLKPSSLFGVVSILCNIPQPYTIRVRDLCRLLRLEKQLFSNILQIFVDDEQRIIKNIREGRANLHVKQLESDITFHIVKREAELATQVNSAAYYGDLLQLKGLIRAGADPNKKDYGGRSPLHIAASRGYEDIMLFLIQESVDINIIDNYGNTPLFEAIKGGHDHVASLLIKEGAVLKIDDAGTFLCTTVARGNVGFIKLALSSGIDPNSIDYDHRTPLHVAASQGFYLLANLLLEAGASVLLKDRWGNTPLDEGKMSGNKHLIELLEEAKSIQLLEFSDTSQNITAKLPTKKCTVFPFHPWKPKDSDCYGVILWVPRTIDELIETAAKQLKCSRNSFIVSEDAGKLFDVDMITDGQKLYLVTRVCEEFFFPGELIMEQGDAVDQIYIVCHGVLEEVSICDNGAEETVSLLKPSSLFGVVSILCNIPQPYTIRVRDLCRLLRLEKQLFSNILQIFVDDEQRIIKNIREGRANLHVKQLESDITFHIVKREAELATQVNSAAYYGDLLQLKGLIRAGADPNKKDYGGRSPLHIAASRGYEDIMLFLIQESVDINIIDNYGNTPLFEAIKGGHDHVASLLIKEGAVLKIDDAGTFLCTTVARGNVGFIKLALSSGIDPNSIDYDHRTPLHVAASQGFYLLANLLLEAGASVLLKDRWGNTPLDEGKMSGNKHLIELLEEAKSIQLLEFSDTSQNITAKLPTKKCTVFPFHPWKPKDSDCYGVILWVPRTIDELIETAAKQLKCSRNSFIVSEDAGKLFDVDMITDGQKLYLVNEN